MFADDDTEEQPGRNSGKGTLQSAQLALWGKNHLMTMANHLLAVLIMWNVPPHSKSHSLKCAFADAAA